MTPQTAAQRNQTYRARRKAKLERLARLEGVLARATRVLEWLSANQPDCYGYEGPFPSTTSSIAVEACLARQALGDVG